VKEWFSRHSDMAITVSVLLVHFYWMNAKFDRVDDKFARVHEEHLQIYKSMAAIEKDVSTIKAVMVMKNIMPQELSCKECD
jgi:hypothetical protein